MKKSAVIFLVVAFIQFITVPAFTSNTRISDSNQSSVQQFSLKTDYSSRINLKKALFSKTWIKEAGLMQETEEEDIATLKKRKTGFLIGGIGLFAAAGLCVWRFTEVDPKKGQEAGAGEAEGERSSTTGMGKMIWAVLGVISAAIGVALIINYSKTNKAIKAKEKELESLSRAQQRLAEALNK